MSDVKGIYAGRPHKAGTILAREMTLRNLKVYNISSLWQCSHRTVYDCLARKRVVRPLELGALCRLLHCNPDQLVDEEGKLLMVDDA